MNKKVHAYLLTALLCTGLLQQTPAQARDHGCDFLCIGMGIAAIGCGIAALCGAFTWSDQDILKWARDGVEDTSIKYAQLNNHHGPLLARLQLFGNRNRASGDWCESKLDRVAKDYPNLAPLHNAHLIIKQDLRSLQKIQAELFKRNLVNHPVCQRFYQELLNLMNNLDQLRDVILSAQEYTAEEQGLHQKLHHLEKERADRERNEALEAQAAAAREQNRIQREKNKKQELENERNCSNVEEIHSFTIRWD